MSIEIQFRAETLSRMLAAALRRALRTSCPPDVPGLSVDRLDVVGGEVTVTQAGGAVELRVPADAFLVSDADLFANPNRPPQGALQPAGRVVFPFRASLDDTAMILAPQKPEAPGVPAPLLDALWDSVKDGISAFTVPVRPVLQALRVTDPGAPDMVTGNGVVAARFGAGGPAVPRLAPGHDWGLFFDAATVTRMIRGLIEPKLGVALGVLQVNARFRHDGGEPGVGVSVDAGVEVLGRRIGARFELDSALRLMAGPPGALRIAAGWSVTIDLAVLVPLFGPLALGVKPLAEAGARAAIASALDVTSFGAVPTGQTSFVLDRALPPLGFGPAQLRYDSLSADESGMVLGGAAHLPAAADAPFRLEAFPFGPPVRLQRCRELAKAGSGAPSLEPATIYNTLVHASAAVEGAGRFCRVEIRSPGSGWRPWIQCPGDGQVIEDFTLRADVSAAEGLALPGPLSFVLRTPRGVRFVDFGRPPQPRTAPDGTLIGVLDDWLDDCLYVVPGRRGRWGIGWQFDKEDFRPRPLEEPGWKTWLREARGVNVQLVTLTGLDPGEFVRFRSSAHAIEATADAAGRLALPVLLPNLGRAAPALLERADGRRLVDNLRLESAVFEPVATLAGAAVARMRATEAGGLVLDVAEGGALARYTLGGFGLVRTDLAMLNPQPLPPGGDDLAALNPQPLPPGGDDLAALNPQLLPPVADGAWTAERLRQTGIRDLEAVFAIPGFAERPVAVARLGDGGMLLLDLAGAKPRISGVMRGPFGALDTAERYALARDGEGVTLFRRADRPAPALPAVPLNAQRDAESAM